MVIDHTSLESLAEGKVYVFCRLWQGIGAGRVLLGLFVVQRSLILRDRAILFFRESACVLDGDRIN